MYVVATFEQSVFLELAISALEQQGLGKEQILAVPLSHRTEARQLFDTIHRADGYSLFDVAAIMGTCGMLLGAIYGMVLAWGPILCGLIGLALGIGLGFLIKFIFVKKRTKAALRAISEVVLLIRCNVDLVQRVEDILWENTALGVARLEL